MIDEKLIKRFIEGAKEAFKEVDNPTFTFPMTILSAYELATSIEELLKEQEAVEPIPPTDESDLWRCGSCGHQLFRCTHQRYCEMCGYEVKWE
jgi:hypothetical protein